MALLRKIFWFALFVALTFSFVILFEYGSKDFITDYPKNAQVELARLQAFTAPSKMKSQDGTGK